MSSGATRHQSVIHSKPSQRKSWAFHGEQGWFVGPALNHYRCLTIYIPKTRAVGITNTAVLIPKMVPIPNADINSHLARTADDLVHLLNGKRDIISPLPNPSVKDALIKIAQLLHRDSTPILSELPCTNIATSEGENSHNSMVTKTQIPALDKQISEGAILSELPCTNIATSEGENSHNSMVTKTQIPALDKLTISL